MRILLESVHKWYNRGEANEVHALKDVGFQAERGEMVCINGPSGSGKSTLLSIIGCLFTPSSGLAMIDGKKLSRLPDRFLTLHRRSTIGFVFQKFLLIPELTVQANIALPLLPLGASSRKIAARTSVLMERLKIEHRKMFLASRISGGEMQRTAIARALVNDPSIVLADEPTAHLDKGLSLEFMDIMAELKTEGKTIIITSHDPLIAEHNHVDRCVEIRDGRIIGEIHTSST